MRRRKQSKLDKELADNARLLRAWRKWHRERLEEVLAGPHGVVAVQVVEFLKTMTPASASALLALMDGQVWADIDSETKFILLHEINAAVTKLRERNGLVPIDDALPGKHLNVFLRIKSKLFP